MRPLTRHRPESAAWSEWLPSPDGHAVYFHDVDRGVEVPLDRVDMPHELWQTIYHFGVDKNYRGLMGWTTSRQLEDADLGALVVAIDDICDVWKVYARGMDADPWNGSLNQLTRQLAEELAKLSPTPDRNELAALGRRVLEYADFLDLHEVFRHV